MSDQIDPIDKQNKLESTEKINILQLNNSLNIVNKKPSSNAVFIVPTTSEESTSTNQLVNAFPPLSNSNQNDDKKSASNKLTLIPLNLNTQSSPIKIATTPIKSLNETTTKTIVSPLVGSKKVIITASNNIVQTSSLITKTDNKPLISSFNGRLPTTNTKIFTISTQNNLKSATQIPINPITTTQPNIKSINTTSLPNNLNSNPNKIQYVKIVNTANNTQQIQMHQQTIPTTVSLASSNNSNSSINSNKAIKITTISTNTNNNAITTTTTNNNNANSSQSSHSSNMDSTNPNRSLSSILSTVTPATVKQLNESSNEATMSPSSSTSALFEAINSNGQMPQMNQSLKLHTYQLISSNNQPKITTTTKTPVIQRIQSINQYNNQPITKTIVSATTSTNASSTNQSNQINNYKVLTQQLPVGNAQQSSQFAFKSLNTTNASNLNKISITKTISTNNSSSLDDLNTNRKQIITTVRNGENANNRQPITQVTSSSNSSNHSLLAKNTTQPISVLNNNNNSNNQHLDENQKSTLEAFSKIFNTASPSTLASSSSTAQANSPGKRLNANRNSANYDQSLASPPSVAQANQMQGSATVPSNLSSNNRKPCNCTKSMCLKLYCDCFAMGSFCHDCNCINCFNTLEHEDERNKAIKMVLDRNPQAFQSKIGKFTAQIPLPKPVEEPMLVATAPPPNTDEIDEIQSRHIKGCNCKKSNCLKRYCECYLAKIQCSTLCKCVGCKNCDESTKTLLQLANASELRKQQQNQHQQNLLLKNSKILMSNQQNQNSLFSTVAPSSSSSMWRNNSARNDLISKHSSFNSSDLVSKNSQDQLKLEQQQQNLNRSYAMLTDEAIEVTCSRLIEKVADELSRLNYDDDDEDSDEEENDIVNGAKTENDSDKTKISNDEQMETLIIEEFGRCLVQLIDTAEKRNKF